VIRILYADCTCFAYQSYYAHLLGHKSLVCVCVCVCVCLEKFSYVYKKVRNQTKITKSDMSALLTSFIFNESYRICIQYTNESHREIFVFKFIAEYTVSDLHSVYDYILYTFTIFIVYTVLNMYTVYDHIQNLKNNQGPLTLPVLYWSM